MVQSGETRRFIDEIEYLLDGIHCSGSKSLILSSLQEIIEKCFDSHTKKVNVNFAMKLKSHGALGIIFDSLQDETDPRIIDNLVLLVVGLLYDVRRMDFFFKPELALKLIKYCFNVNNNDIPDGIYIPDGVNIPDGIDILKSSQLFTNVPVSRDEIYEFVGIWMLYKWTFSNLTSKSSSSFFPLEASEIIFKRIIKIIKIGSEEIGKKASGLLDYLIMNSLLDMKEFSIDLIDLLKNVIEKHLLNVKRDVSFMKLAVSITGSPLFGKQSEVEKEELFEFIQDFTELASNSDNDNENTDNGNVTILALSCLVNLTDRCDDSFIEEFRYQKYKKSSSFSLLEHFTEEYNKYKLPLNSNRSDISNESDISTLLALLLGFICRQNRTNLQVMLSVPSCGTNLKKEIFTVASNFYLQQEKSLKRSGGDGNEEDAGIVIERLNEIILTFKQ